MKRIYRVLPMAYNYDNYLDYIIIEEGTNNLIYLFSKDFNKETLTYEKSYIYNRYQRFLVDNETEILKVYTADGNIFFKSKESEEKKMSNKKKINEILKEECEKDKKIIDACYDDEMKKIIEKRYRKDFPIDTMKKFMNEKCYIEVDKENDVTCKAHLGGNPIALLFTLYMLEDNIKEQYAIPDPVADIIKLIKNNEYRSEVYQKNDK